MKAVLCLRYRRLIGRTVHDPSTPFEQGFVRRALLAPGSWLVACIVCFARDQGTARRRTAA
jgi:hypothetical protein